MLGIEKQATDTWGPFMMPGNAAEFSALDMGRILQTGNPLEWYTLIAKDPDVEVKL